MEGNMLFLINLGLSNDDNGGYNGVVTGGITYIKIQN